MTHLLELARGDGPLDTWVRTLTLGALLLLCVALISTTLLLRNPKREQPSALLARDEFATLAPPLPRSIP